ncbi:MAG TPA: prephenate dehydrogenase/arogenate dehydrogenase family protein [Acidimicrobiales bacterium]|nr:prephenate dehydrogenase/arogenate dehydrogenase family protein [Acidimicrobiales bacterium]
MTSPSSPGPTSNPGPAHTSAAPAAGDDPAERVTTSGLPRAAIVGTGLIGGSIGMALRRLGWLVSGVDNDPARVQRALELGAIDRVGWDLSAAVTFVAVPAGAVADVARDVLSRQDAEAVTSTGTATAPGPAPGRARVQAVTDVAGVKAGIVAAVGHPRFVGGHPMAGSEQEGVEGAGPDLFLGATWVLTPGRHTSGDAYSEVQALVRLLGANPVVLEPRRHDELVALVSHTPHLTAAALMNLAADEAASDAVLLRLAAGGFRDMTRVAAGHPGIWPDVVAENQDAILDALDRLSASLDQLRAVVAGKDRAKLLELLERAREARVSLPTGAPALSRATELRLPVPDRPGVIAEVSTLLGGQGVNIFDLEIAHSAEGDRGVMVLIIDAGAEGVARKALAERDFKVSARRLEP